MWRKIMSARSSRIKVAIIAGYGLGIGAAVARHLGREGYSLALLARTKQRLDAAVKVGLQLQLQTALLPPPLKLKRAGISARSFPTDLSDAAAVKAAVADVRTEMGAPISLVFWNPYGAINSLLQAKSSELASSFNTCVTGLVAAVQAAHSDLKVTSGAILVIGGGLSLEADAMTALAVQHSMMTLAVSKAAQRKLVHIMHQQLGPDGIYVGEVTVMGAVEGTPADPAGESQLTPDKVAQVFLELLHKRDASVWCVQCE